MKVNLMALVASLVTTSPAIASEWWIVGAVNDREGAKMSFMDRQSIKQVTPEIRSVWMRLIFQRTTNPFASLTALQQYNCRTSRYRTVTVTRYASDKTVLGTSPGDKSWEYIIPDSAADAMKTFVCDTRGQGEAIKVEEGSDPDETAARVFDYFETHRK